MTRSESRLSADDVTLLLGVVAIVGGVATGLFSDLRLLGQVLGLAAFAAWVVAVGMTLWGPGSGAATARWITGAAFVLTAALLLYAFVTGPRLSARTLVLTPAGAQVVSAACPDAVDGTRVAARVALNQLPDPFVHIELVAEGCDRAGEDIRLRSEDLRAVLSP